MPRWCATRADSAAGSTGPTWTGSWCATVCRCSARATSGSSARACTQLATRLGFRRPTASPSALIYREFFPRGLTALDDLDEETLGTRPSLAHVTAREEVMNLLASSSCRSTSAAAAAPPPAPNGSPRQNKPLEVDDLIEK